MKYLNVNHFASFADIPFLERHFIAVGILLLRKETPVSIAMMAKSVGTLHNVWSLEIETKMLPYIVAGPTKKPSKMKKVKKKYKKWADLFSCK